MSWGPDVEMIVPLPVVLAVESKNTFGDALEDFNQIVGYRIAKKYDAIILRIEKRIKGDEEEHKLVLEKSSKLGIGVVLGGYSYSPLMGTEKVLARASLDFTSNFSEVVKDMGHAVQILKIPLDRLFVFREFFEANYYE
jgi:hypothetical protein